MIYIFPANIITYYVRIFWILPDSRAVYNARFGRPSKNACKPHADKNGQGGEENRYYLQTSFMENPLGYMHEQKPASGKLSRLYGSQFSAAKFGKFRGSQCQYR